MEKKICLAVIALALVIGCASAGQYFTIYDANRIKNGMTREEVIAAMGTNPYQITDQGKTFVWSYAKVGFWGNTESRAVKFKFDENGKTYDIPETGVYGDTQKYLDK